MPGGSGITNTSEEQCTRDAWIWSKWLKLQMAEDDLSEVLPMCTIEGRALTCGTEISELLDIANANQIPLENMKA
ncbi:hypothetical protein Tco_0988342 [Tanacetum coccineum]|uniref:Uncharacterized protein n=1 Tax=Tanacetum coccineum TaxID=301880 RepID=A0ABQ5ER50_9ASTR